VTDERRVYYPDLGLYRTWLGAGSPERHGQASYAKARGLEKRPDDVVIWSSVGLAGYYAGPAVHIIDRNALADPLLARLPPQPGWRIGHFVRAEPAGYFESCKQRQNLIEDPGMRALYDDVLMLTRAPVFTPGRFAAIWRRR
jgi:arabinofuranosyltransferase